MDPTIIAAAIVTVLAALTGAAVTIINAAAAARDRKDSQHERVVLKETAQATNAKADTIIEKAAEIHTLADGNLSKVTAALGVANEKIIGLEKLVAEVIRRSTPGNGGIVDSLHKIDESIAVIEKNTAPTEDKA